MRDRNQKNPPPARRRIAVLALAMPLLLAAAAAAQDEPIAPLLAGMGEHHHPISSEQERAQTFFDQGMVLAFGFNHAEAERAFREAARVDPECAICWWGVSWTLGPNINLPMLPEAAAPAWEALGRARDLAVHASERERAYIEALAVRYAAEPSEDRAALDGAFADAMREVVRAHPDDLDAATIFAESLMDLAPWDYWTPEGRPKPETEELITVLENVMERAPDHPGANHLYIHAVEARYPERGEAAADRLRGLVPGAGHLVHMPSHIYMRVGRYHEAAAVNVEADLADEEYVAQCHAQGIYPLAYHSHNVHFIWAATAMEGRSADALGAARKLAERHHEQHDMMVDPDWVTLQYYYSMPLYSLARFGRWDEILAEPQPAADLVYTNAVWHYARGLALARRGDLEAATRELDRLAGFAADPAMEELSIWGNNSFAHVFRIAQEVLAGEIAAARGDWETAVAHLEEGVFQEEALIYQEPTDWYFPVRQALGAVLLAAGRPDEAEEVYRRDLEINPANGWSLFGLAQSLEAQGRDAAESHSRFQVAWQYADVELTTSRF
jgi:tetratricopeptide (TPR) repeat protein